VLVARARVGFRVQHDASRPSASVLRKHSLTSLPRKHASSPRSRRATSPTASVHLPRSSVIAPDGVEPAGRSRPGIPKGIPACRILSWRARVAGHRCRNMRTPSDEAASSPSTTANQRRTVPTSMAGCAQANINARRWSGSAGPPPQRPALARGLNCPPRSHRCAVAGEIDHLSPGDGQQPCSVDGQPLRGQSVTPQRTPPTAHPRGGHIPRACRKKGDELAVTAARGRSAVLRARSRLRWSSSANAPRRKLTAHDILAQDGPQSTQNGLDPGPDNAPPTDRGIEIGTSMR